MRKISKSVHTSANINFFLKKCCSGLVEGVDLIFRIVCQISGQDNVIYESENLIGIFRSKIFFLVVLIGAKGYCRNICFNEGFVYNRNFNNCAALLSENSKKNSTNSLKLEPRTKRSCKILIVIL